MGRSAMKRRFTGMMLITVLAFLLAGSDSGARL